MSQTGIILCFHWTLFVAVLSGFCVRGQIIALYRPTLQVGTYESHEARLAVDNNTGTYALANTDNTPAWWSVDLQATAVIRGVTIIAPQQGTEYRYLESFIVTVDTVENNITSKRLTCFYFNNKTGLGSGVEIRRQCESDRQGNYVTVTRIGGTQPRSLGIAELQIDGTLLVGNQAWYKETQQIGTFGGYISANAVDYRNDTCAIAAVAEGSLAWWQVDLGSTYMYRVTSVIVSVTTTESANQYFQNVVITVDSSDITNSQRICATYNNGSAINPGVKLTLTCSSPLDGRYVTIRRQGGGLQPWSLGLCDVQVIGEYIAGPFTTAATSTTTASTSTSTKTSPGPTPIHSQSTTTEAAGPSNTIDPNLTSTTTLTIDDSSTTERNTTTSGSGLSGGAIAGIVIGCIAFAAITAALIILGVYYFKKRRESTGSGSPMKRISVLTLKDIKIPNLFSSGKDGTTENRSSDRPALPLKPSSAKSKPAQPILRAELAQYVKNQLSKEEGFKTEFKELSDKELDKVTIGKMKSNTGKNRFQNIVPYDKTLVSLVAEDKSESGDTYINASFIKGYPNIEKKYIATQGPKPNTVDAFWRMIWQQNVDLIVMITPLVENGKGKCTMYWPDGVRNKKEFGKYRIETDVQDKFCDYTYRELIVENTSKPYDTSRRIRHMHFESWCDKSAPDECFPLLSFQRRVDRLDQGNHPIVVHCSAGIGRTGTFICIDYLLKQLQAEGKLSVYNCVDKLRHQRMNMVQTTDQYAFVYESILETIEIGEEGTAIPIEQIQAENDRLRSCGQMEKQFAVLQNMKWKNTENRRSMGTQRENFHKNRQKEVVAFDDCRPYLNVVYSNSGSNYINAVYVNSYRMKDAYTLTQCPLPDTVTDFWSLVWDQKLQTIVLLDELDGRDPTCPIYWPTDLSSTISHGSLDISLCSSQSENNCVQVHEFSLVNSKERNGDILKVKLFQLCNAWPVGHQAPTSTAPLIQLIKTVEVWHDQLQQASKTVTEGKTILQCIDGYTRCGLLATALCLFGRMKMEQEADVFLSCRYVTCNRPESIDSMDQYMYLHDLAEASASSSIDGVYYNT